MEVRLSSQAPEALLLITDLSLGGAGVWVQRGQGPRAGERLTLDLRLGEAHVTVAAEVRHVSGDGTHCGLEFVDVTEDAHRALNRHVSELAERGSMA